MHILVTNDDGVHAPGLLALVQQLRDMGRLTVLAPHRNWSASGHVKTMHRPLRVWEVNLADGTPAYTTDGAPSDCVALATLGFIDESIDLVVSGINPAANLGHDVTYSGTVTAAMESAISGLPGVAVSLDLHRAADDPEDFASAARVAASVTRQAMADGLPDGVFLNVNVPDLAWNSLRGLSVTRQGQRVYRDALVRREDPRGRPYFWIGGEAPSGLTEPGTDIWALAEGYVSITPLHLDLTADNHFEPLEGWNLNA